MAEIARTATEPVTLTWLQDGAPVTGASPTMRVRRASDGFATVYDWTALAFVNPATATAPFVVLAPTDPTYEPGIYWHTFEPAAASNAVAPDIYRVTYYADATLDAPLGTAEIRVGTVDTIDTTAGDAATTLGRVDVATSTRASSTALADVAADAAQTVDALYNAKRLAANGTLTQYAADGVTPAYVATVTDKTGQPIDLQAGEPARTTALVPVP